MANKVYDAEGSVAHNGKWILFGSQRSDKMELWKSDIKGVSGRTMRMQVCRQTRYVIVNGRPLQNSILKLTGIGRVASDRVA